MVRNINNLLYKLFKRSPKSFLFETGHSDKRYKKSDFLENVILKKQIEYCLVDTRDEKDYLKGHIPTAVNVPFKRIKTQFPTEMLFATVVVYGYSDRESHKAARILNDSGYFNVVSYGSYQKWTKSFETGKNGDEINNE